MTILAQFGSNTLDFLCFLSVFLLVALPLLGMLHVIERFLGRTIDFERPVVRTWQHSLRKVREAKRQRDMRLAPRKIRKHP